MAIELWTARLERPLTEREMETLPLLLPPERRARLERLKEPGKAREPLCAYLMLYLALRQTYGWKHFPAMAYTERGKPFFPDYPEVQFNLSHTSGAVLVGISDQPVGVDIEKVRPVSSRAMQRIAGVTTEEEFFCSWVRREARTKRSGDGVATMMRAEAPLRYGEFYYEVDTFPGYVAGVATRSHDIPTKVRKYSLDEML